MGRLEWAERVRLPFSRKDLARARIFIFVLLEILSLMWLEISPSYWRVSERKSSLATSIILSRRPLFLPPSFPPSLLFPSLPPSLPPSCPSALPISFTLSTPPPLSQSSLSSPLHLYTMLSLQALGPRYCNTSCLGFNIKCISHHIHHIVCLYADGCWWRWWGRKRSASA